MIYIHVLDYSTGINRIFSVEKTNDIEGLLQDLGYNLNNIEYMYSDTLKVEINI